MLNVIAMLLAFVPQPLPSRPVTAPAHAAQSTPQMSMMDGRPSSRRDMILGLAAAAAAVPSAAFAGSREDGVAALRKQAAAAKKKGGPGDVVYVKGKTKSAIWLGPPKGSGADKCKVSKPCTTGAGIKWDAKALGVNGGTYDAGKKGEISNRLFLKTPTYSDSKY